MPDFLLRKKLPHTNARYVVPKNLNNISINMNSTALRGTWRMLQIADFRITMSLSMLYTVT